MPQRNRNGAHGAGGAESGSDVANLAVLGYDTRECYTGRSPLEAANIGVELSDTDVAFRCNLVTLSEDADFTEKTILDYCGRDSHTEEARVLVEAVQEAFGGEEFDFYTGTAYRHCMVWHNGREPARLTPAPRHHRPGDRSASFRRSRGRSPAVHDGAELPAA